MIVVVQLRYKQLGFEEDIDMLNAYLKSSSQEAIDTITFYLVVGYDAHAYSVDVDQLVRGGVDYPCSQGKVPRPSACSIYESHILV